MTIEAIKPKRTTFEEQKQIGATIISQLGGNMFNAMTGAKNFLCGEDKSQNVFICFKHMRTSSGEFKSLNYCKITLNACDTYDMEFSYVTINGVKTKTTERGQYDDMIADTFARITGLAVRI